MLPYHLEKDGTQCVVSWRHFSWVVLFLFAWLAIWTFGCVPLANMVFVERHFAAIFFALPFWGAWFFVAGMIVNMFFGKTKIRLDADGFESDWTCLFVTRSKRIELADLRRFEVHAYSRKGGATYALRVAYGEKHADFSIPVRCGELEPLRDLLNDFLATLKNEPTIAVEAPKAKKTEPIVFELKTPSKEVERPKETRWRFDTTFDGFEFSKRELFSFVNLIGTLFIACFWNGIVSVFVLILWGFLPTKNPPLGWQWWIMFFFLIPFELIGLVMIHAFLYNLFAPFLKTNWNFCYGETVHRSPSILFRKAKTYSLDGWKTLAVRLEPDDDEPEEYDEEDREIDEEGDYWQLAFLDRDGTALTTIGELDKSEALWMADVVLREKRSIR